MTPAGGREVPRMLHPDVARFLRQVNEAGAPPLETLPLAEVRRILEVPPPGPPLPLARVEDVVVAGRPARLYCATRQDPVPVVALFHGGGWAAGSLDSQDASCRVLASELRDVAVVSVDYRQPPEHPYPAAAEDACAAVAWLGDEGASLGLGPHVAVAGGSAGGNLAAVACQRARGRVRAQVLHCPVLDCDLDRPSYREFAEGYLVTRASLAWFWGLYVPDPGRRGEPAASPLRAEDLRGLPPTLVQTAECDPLRDEGEAYARRLQEAGVPTVLTRSEGHVHDPWNTFAVQPGGLASLQEAARFLRAHL